MPEAGAEADADGGVVEPDALFRGAVVKLEGERAVDAEEHLLETAVRVAAADGAGVGEVVDEIDALDREGDLLAGFGDEEVAVGRVGEAAQADEAGIFYGDPQGFLHGRLFTEAFLWAGFKGDW